MTSLHQLSRTQCRQIYLSALVDQDTETQRQLCLTDLFYLLTVALRRHDADNEFVFARCREFEAAPDGHLDLWAREHYKSTLITFSGTVQEILRNPDITVGIFSHTRPIAKGFLQQIRDELAGNTYLHGLFPGVLYSDPGREARSWGLDTGITVKRTSNPKEATVEAWGLVDGQPTSKHYQLLIYDDVVTKESVSTPEMMKKTTDAWALSLNLGAEGGRRRTIGTRYHLNDTYGEILRRGAAIPRIHPAQVGGVIDGAPVYMSAETLAEKRRNMGPYIYACQMLQNPVEDSMQGFKADWLLKSEFRPDARWNYYILVDPAGSKKKTSDYTVMVVIALGHDGNYYLCHGVRDRMNLTERADMLCDLERQWQPIRTGYEQYGMQADIQHIQYRQDQENYRFPIIPLGGSMPKRDRIERLVPIFEQGRFYMPPGIKYRDREGKVRDFVDEFIRDEYSAYPVAVHDDMLDAIARIVDPDLGAQFPKIDTQVTKRQTRTANNTYNVLGGNRSAHAAGGR